MSYQRVIPRDLFNEASLLKCAGQLWLQTECLPHVVMRSNGDRFKIEQDQSDGSLILANVRLHIHGRRFILSRPLNSREAWPLYIRDKLKADAEDVPVFNGDGSLTSEFMALAKGGAT